ncbi:MAG: hypothetical protein ABEN55_20910 [Bradymonadaceae bacterium]
MNKRLVRRDFFELFEYKGGSKHNPFEIMMHPAVNASAGYGKFESQPSSCKANGEPRSIFETAQITSGQLT